MAIKTLKYTVTADSISPNYERRAGMQYDHKKTGLQFVLEGEFYDSILEMLGQNSALYRFDCYDGEGKLHTGELKELGSASLIPYELEYGITKFGGKPKVNLVITITNDESTVMEWSYEAALYLENLPKSDSDEGDYQSVATLASITEELVKETRDKYQEILSMHKKLTELESLFKDGEFVFDGNDGSEIDIDFVVDDRFDINSNNALANKVITARFDTVDDSVKKLKDNIGQDVYKMVVDEIKDEILQAAHPIGSYYWSDKATSPTELFGGEWEKVEDVFVLAAGSEFGAGSTGGEKEHKLIASEMPKHKHMFVPNADVEGINFVVPTTKTGTGVSSIAREGKAHYPGHWANSTWGTDERGGGNSHNNMPPYVAVYCWKRIG